ncbi:MAG: hypothetical protein KIS30_06955 [Thermoplasmata archaeon]|nr:hypothetical protein [Candidatus Sysuiplasma acidicola]MBX8646476.1 hypothetical protein [Candidatus Sysuiplasma acidicola]
MKPQTGSLRVALTGSERIALANEYAYFCGFADFSARPMGFHLPGEMGGLWDPPLRLFSGIDVMSQGRRMMPSGLLVKASWVELDYGSFGVDISMPEHVLMFIEVKNARGLDVEIGFDMNLHPIWLSDFDTRCTTETRKGKMSLNIPSMGRTYVLETDARDLSACGGNVRVGDNRNFSLALYRVTGSNHIGARAALKQTAARHQRHACDTVLENVDGQISEAFLWAKHSLRTLTHRQEGIGRGLTAGYCDFPWYFSIDFFYSIDALLETGMCSVARDTLRLFIRYARRQGGRVPHELVTNGVIYNPGDLEESAMLSTAVLRYVSWVGDAHFARAHFRDCLASLDFVNSMQFKGPGIMEDAARGSSVEIDTLCYFIEGVESLQALRNMAFDRRSSAFSSEMAELKRASKEASRIVNAVMWSNELSTYANRMTDGVPEQLGFWTSIVPFLTGVASPERYRRFSESENGLKSMTGRDGLLIGSGILKTMAIQNGLMSLAASRYADIENALLFYMHNVRHAGEFMPGVVPEIFNDPAGCYMQAWSSAAIIHPLVGGILGIIPDGGRLRGGKRAGSTLDGLRISGLPFRGRKYNFEVVQGVVVCRPPVRQRAASRR